MATKILNKMLTLDFGLLSLSIVHKKHLHLQSSLLEVNQASISLVVLYSGNISRDKDSILNQIYEKQICSDFYYDDFDFLY